MAVGAQACVARLETIRKTSGHRSTFANQGDMRLSVDTVSPELTVTLIAVMTEVRAFSTLTSEARVSDSVDRGGHQYRMGLLPMGEGGTRMGV